MAERWHTTYSCQTCGTSAVELHDFSCDECENDYAFIRWCDRCEQHRPVEERKEWG